MEQAPSHSAIQGKQYRSISFSTKFKLNKSLVLSILLYGCESWTLKADLERRIQAFENKRYKMILGISYREHTNKLICMAKGKISSQDVRSFY